MATLCAWTCPAARTVRPASRAQSRWRRADSGARRPLAGAAWGPPRGGRYTGWHDGGEGSRKRVNVGLAAAAPSEVRRRAALEGVGGVGRARLLTGCRTCLPRLGAQVAAALLLPPSATAIPGAPTVELMPGRGTAVQLAGVLPDSGDVLTVDMQGQVRAVPPLRQAERPSLCAHNRARLLPALLTRSRAPRGQVNTWSASATARSGLGWLTPTQSWRLSPTVTSFVPAAGNEPVMLDSEEAAATPCDADGEPHPMWLRRHRHLARKPFPLPHRGRVRQRQDLSLRYARRS